MMMSQSQSATLMFHLAAAVKCAIEKATEKGGNSSSSSSPPSPNLDPNLNNYEELPKSICFNMREVNGGTSFTPCPPEKIPQNLAPVLIKAPELRRSASVGDLGAEEKNVGICVSVPVKNVGLNGFKIYPPLPALAPVQLKMSSSQQASTPDKEEKKLNDILISSEDKFKNSSATASSDNIICHESESERGSDTTTSLNISSKNVEQTLVIEGDKSSNMSAIKTLLDDRLMLINSVSSSSSPLELYSSSGSTNCSILSEDSPLIGKKLELFSISSIPKDAEVLPPNCLNFNNNLRGNIITLVTPEPTPVITIIDSESEEESSSAKNTQNEEEEENRKISFNYPAAAAELKNNSREEVLLRKDEEVLCINLKDQKKRDDEELIEEVGDLVIVEPIIECKEGEEMIEMRRSNFESTSQSSSHHEIINYVVADEDEVVEIPQRVSFQTVLLDHNYVVRPKYAPNLYSVRGDEERGEFGSSLLSSALMSRVITSVGPSGPKEPLPHPSPLFTKIPPFSPTPSPTSSGGRKPKATPLPKQVVRRERKSALVTPPPLPGDIRPKRKYVRRALKNKGENQALIPPQPPTEHNNTSISSPHLPLLPNGNSNGMLGGGGSSSFGMMNGGGERSPPGMRVEVNFENGSEESAAVDALAMLSGKKFILSPPLPSPLHLPLHPPPPPPPPSSLPPLQSPLQPPLTQLSPRTHFTPICLPPPPHSQPSMPPSLHGAMYSPSLPLYAPPEKGTGREVRKTPSSLTGTKGGRKGGRVSKLGEGKGSRIGRGGKKSLEPPTLVSPEVEKGSEESGEAWVCRCICGFDYDDGFMVYCDGCTVWQHVECMEMDGEALALKSTYFCERCEPREVSVARAKGIQSRKLEESRRGRGDTSGDESESEVLLRRSSSSSTRSPADPNLKPLPITTTTSSSSNKLLETRSSGLSRETRENGRLGGRETPTPPTNANGTGTGSSRGSGGGKGGRRGRGSGESGEGGYGKKTKAPRKQQLRLLTNGHLSPPHLLPSPPLPLSPSLPLSPPHSSKGKSSPPPPPLPSPPISSTTPTSTSTSSSLPPQPTTACPCPYASSPLLDKYEEAVASHYSQELRAKLPKCSSDGGGGGGGGGSEFKRGGGAKWGYGAVGLNGGKVLRTLVANERIERREAVVEFMGKFKTLANFESRASIKKGSGSSSSGVVGPKTILPEPFTFFYQIPENGMCISIDCRNYGNGARFVRRSCTPNAELRHVMVGKETVHVYVVSTRDIEIGEEITIPHEHMSIDCGTKSGLRVLSPPLPCACPSPSTCSSSSSSLSPPILPPPHSSPPQLTLSPLSNSPGVSMEAGRNEESSGNDIGSSNGMNGAAGSSGAGVTGPPSATPDSKSRVERKRRTSSRKLSLHELPESTPPPVPVESSRGSRRQSLASEVELGNLKAEGGKERSPPKEPLSSPTTLHGSGSGKDRVTRLKRATVERPLPGSSDDETYVPPVSRRKSSEGPSGGRARVKSGGKEASSEPVPQPQHSSPHSTPTTPTTPTSGAKIKQGATLTREDRKLQAVLKLIEKMESSQRRDEKRKSGRKESRSSRDDEGSPLKEIREIPPPPPTPELSSSRQTNSSPLKIFGGGGKRKGKKRSKSFSTKLAKHLSKKRKVLAGLGGPELRATSESDFNSGDELGHLKSSPGSEFRFPKTKKYMMSSGALETSSEETESYSSHYLNPPSADTGPIVPHYMRSRSSGGGSSVSSPSLHHLPTTPSQSPNPASSLAGTRVEGGGGSDSCSAKKRWLRQAINEEIPSNSSSRPASPFGGERDAPLKKRRLARESISSEISPPTTPSNCYSDVERESGTREGGGAETPIGGNGTPSLSYEPVSEDEFSKQLQNSTEEATEPHKIEAEKGACGYEAISDISEEEEGEIIDEPSSKKESKTGVSIEMNGSSSVEPCVVFRGEFGSGEVVFRRESGGEWEEEKKNKREEEEEAARLKKKLSISEYRNRKQSEPDSSSRTGHSSSESSRDSSSFHNAPQLPPSSNSNSNPKPNAVPGKNGGTPDVGCDETDWQSLESKSNEIDERVKSLFGKIQEASVDISNRTTPDPYSSGRLSNHSNNSSTSHLNGGRNWGSSFPRRLPLLTPAARKQISMPPLSPLLNGSSPYTPSFSSSSSSSSSSQQHNNNNRDNRDRDGRDRDYYNGPHGNSNGNGGLIGGLPRSQLIPPPPSRSSYEKR